jgi:hypothetical protein
MDLAVRTKSVTIASGASLSGALSIGERTLVALAMPATWTAASITLQVSLDGTTFQNVYDANGDEVTITTAASRTILLDPAFYTALNFVKFRSGTSAAAVNQGGDRVLTVAHRSFS